MNDKNQDDLLPPDDLAPVKKKKKAKKSKLVKVRNTGSRNIMGYNVIYKPGDEFEITESSAEMLIKQRRVELVSNANKDEST